MIRHILALAAIAAGFGVAHAQSASSAAAPGGFAPMIAPCVVQANGSCLAVSVSNPLPVTGGTGGGGGGSGDASAANQVTLNDRIGALTSPATGSVNQRLGAISATLGSPFQAGGSIGNTVFGATQSGTWTIAGISGTVSLPTGASTAANQVTLNGYVDGLEAAIGAPADAAWGGSGSATQTAILKSVDASLRIVATAAQDTSTPSVAVTSSALPTGAATEATLAAQSAKLPASVGTKTNGTSLAVVTPKSATGTSSNVAAATASTQLLVANAARNGCNILNDSSSALYLKLGTSASSTSFDYYMAPAANGVPASFSCPADWTGAIYGAWVTSAGTARVSERSN